MKKPIKFDRGNGLLQVSTSEIQTLIHEGVPMAKSLGFEVVELTKQGAIAKIPFQGHFVRPGNSLSGPVIMALADAAMYAAILAHAGQEEMAVTSNINVNFLQRPLPEDLHAEANILKLGKRLVFCEVSIYSPSQDGIVAHATGSYARPPAR